jgi:hypothetical protein
VDRQEPRCTGADDFEPNDSDEAARPWVAPVSAGVTCNNDQDWFLVDAEPGSEVTAVLTWATAPASTITMQLWSHGSAGVLLAEAAGVAGGLSMHSSGVPGPVALRVASSHWDHVSYQLQVTHTPPNQCSPDGFEPNDTQDTAARMPGGAVAARLCVPDDDWYLVEVAEPGSQVKLELTPGAGTANADLSLHAPSGQQVAQSAAPWGLAEVVDTRVDVPGLYAARVHPFPEEGTQVSYTLSSRVTPPGPACVDDRFEDNDTPATATWHLPPTGELEARLCPLDADYFIYDQERAGPASVSVRYAAGTTVRLSFSSASQVLGDSIGSGGMQGLSLSGVAAGTYLVGVEGTLTGSAGLSYAVGRGPPPCTGQDAHEPNDTSGAARAYAGPSLSGVTCNGDQDWFAVEARQGDDVMAAVSSASGPPPTVQVYDSQTPPRLLADGTLSGSLRTAWAGGVPGRVLVRVVSEPSETLAYTLQVTVSTPQTCVPDGFEPNESQAQARGLVNGGAVATVCRVDHDWYTVPVGRAGARVVVEMTPGPSAEDLDMALHDPAGNQVARSENPPPNAERMEFTAQVTGTHAIHVYGFPPDRPNAGQGPYTLSARVEDGPPVCVDDGMEPNDGPLATSFYVGLGGRLEGILCPGNPDHFLLDMMAGQVAVATVQVPQGARVALRAWDRDRLLAENSGGPAVELRFVAPRQGTFAVGVEWGGQEQAGIRYSLAVVEERCTGADAWEPNNTSSAPRTYTPPSVSGVTCNGDEDWFRLDSSPGEEVNALLTGPGAERALFLLYDANRPSQALADSIPVAGGRTLTFTGVPGNTLLRVVGLDPAAVAYTLQATRTMPQTCTPDAYEPNDSLAASKPLVSGGVSATICLGDNDFFHVDVAEAGSLIRVDLVPSMSASDLDVVLLDRAGNPLAIGQNPAGMPENMTLTVAQAGRYTIWVYGWPPNDPSSGQGAYTLTAVVEPPSQACVDDQLEPNDRPEEAWFVLEPNAAMDLVLCPGNDDFFQVWSQDGTVNVTMRFAPGTDVRLVLLGRNGPLAEVGGNAGILTLTSTNLQPGTYVLGVSGRVPGPRGLSYRLESAVQVCTGADAHEPNQSRQAARAYAAPGMSGVSCNGDEEWFSFEAQRGDTVSAVLAMPGVPLDVLQLYDANGVMIADSMVMENARLSGAQNVSGRVFARVVGYAAEAAAYTLTMNRNSPNQCVPDAYEPNETQAAARPYTAPLTAQVCASDHDWYAITVPQAGMRISMQLYPDPTGGDIDVRLHAPNGAVVATSERGQGQPESISFTAPSAGTYALHVYGFPDGQPNAAQGMYFLTVEVTAPNPDCEDDRYEDNDSPDTMAILGSGSQELFLRMCPNDRDFFGVFLDQGGTLTVRMDYPAPPRLRLTVLNSAQQQLGDSNSNSGYEEVRLEGLPPDLYIIRVQSPGAQEPGRDYHLVVEAEGQQCDGDFGEPNNDFSTATPVETRSVTRAVACGPMDVDHYSMQPQVNHAVELRLDTPQDPFGSIDALIVASDGYTVLAATYNQPPGPSRTIRADIRRVGTYYVQVYNNGFTMEPIAYTLTLNELPNLLCRDDSYEENDGPVEAPLVPRGTRVQGVACPADGEWFAYDFRAGVTQSINVTTPAMTDGSFDLVAPNGADVLATGYVNWQPINTRIPANGRYFVRVNFFWPAETGDAYTLTVDP